MINIGITGQSGFIGTHLYNTLGLYPGTFTRIPFEDSFFENELKLNEFVSQCDVIVHLAALNRHNDPGVIYETNLRLVKQLIRACESTHSKPHIIFSSSTQEQLDNPYGRSKKEGRRLFEEWAGKNNARFTALIIPNVFGPFGNPYYNSVVATFCHQLTHNEQPVIHVDKEINLIYVGELVERIVEIILRHSVAQSSNTELHSKEKEGSQRNTVSNTLKLCETFSIQPTSNIKVSSLLQKLLEYKALYLNKGIIPDLTDTFHRNLFNTFLCYVDHNEFFPFPLDKKVDARGNFTEIGKFFSGGQISFSVTKPGITRGNHFHTRKAERFAVIKGKARIEIRRIGTNNKLIFELDGNKPSFVDMPIWFTHNITNTGEQDLYTIFWTNEHFNPEDSDTWFEKV